MTRYMRNWIRICSVGLALVAFAWINLDSSPRPMPGTPTWVHQPDWRERLAESLGVLPVALLGGALWGAIFGAGTFVVRDMVRWVMALFDRSTDCRPARSRD
jgi:hypothetical protein